MCTHNFLQSSYIQHWNHSHVHLMHTHSHLNSWYHNWDDNIMQIQNILACWNSYLCSCLLHHRYSRVYKYTQNFQWHHGIQHCHCRCVFLPNIHWCLDVMGGGRGGVISSVHKHEYGIIIELTNTVSSITWIAWVTKYTLVASKGVHTHCIGTTYSWLQVTFVNI